MSLNKTLNDWRSNELLLRLAIPNFDGYEPEERERIRRAWTLKQPKVLAMYGNDSDSDLDGLNQTGNGTEKYIYG